MAVLPWPAELASFDAYQLDNPRASEDRWKAARREYAASVTAVDAPDDKLREIVKFDPARTVKPFGH